MFQKSFLFHFLWIPAAVFGPTNSTAASSITNYTILSKPGCESKCGNVDVPYPFGIGIGTGCALDSPFEINCSTASTPAKAFLGRGNLEVIDINGTEVRVKNWVASSCYNRTGGLIQSNWTSIDLNSQPFAFSDLNMFTVIGCDDLAILRGSRGRNFTKACASFCYSKEDVEGDCSGLGCCQTSVPKGTKSFNTSVGSSSNHVGVWSFNRCGYSFVREATRFQFLGASDLLDESFMKRTVESVPSFLAMSHPTHYLIVPFRLSSRGPKYLQ